MGSEELFRQASGLMPGGVSSPVRAIRPYPFYTSGASGPRIHTVDGEDYIDCCLGYGPLLLGHCHPFVMNAIHEQVGSGWLYGTPTPLEIQLAAMITGDHPGMDMVRFVSTGSEATMAAIRAARGFTGRPDIVKIEGGFHGAHDAVLVQAGSGATTLGVPDSAGVPADVTAHTRQVPFNDPEALEAVFAGSESIAALIMEPVLGNIGPVLPKPGYLDEVRAITRDHDVLLILDEVITGYRLGIGGAQARFRVRPDMTTFGKIIGGGLPIGAFCGRRDIMEMIAPAGPVYQAGTFSGNPLSLAAGIAALGWLHQNEGVYRHLEEQVRVIGEAVPADAGGSFVSIGSMFKYFFRGTAPSDYAEVKESDTAKFSQFWQKMLRHGIFLPPSQFETNFLSVAHGRKETDAIASGYRTCLSG